MTARLDVALEALQPLLNTHDASAAVDRVDIGAGGDLRLSIMESGRPRWFGHDDRGLVEQLPQHDTGIPLASRLKATDRLLAYRPGRRIVIARESRGERTIVKGYRRRRSEKAARLHRIAASTVASHELRIPQLYFHGAQLDALVFENLVGRPLRPVEASVDAFFAVGSSLRGFQAAASAAPLNDFSVEDELAVLRRWSERAELVLGDLPNDWIATCFRVRDLGQRLPEPRIGLCHRDLHDGQFLEMEHGIALLDFDLLCRADTALDPANLLAHFTLRALQRADGATDSSAHQAGEALLDGLCETDDASFGARLRFYQATSFLRLALVYAVRPRWRHLSDTLTRIGSRCLDESESRC